MCQGSLQNLAVGPMVTQPKEQWLWSSRGLPSHAGATPTPSLKPCGMDRHRARMQGNRLWWVAGCDVWTWCAENEEKDGNRWRPGGLGRHQCSKLMIMCPASPTHLLKEHLQKKGGRIGETYALGLKQGWEYNRICETLRMGMKPERKSSFGWYSSTITCFGFLSVFLLWINVSHWLLVGCFELGSIF